MLLYMLFVYEQNRSQLLHHVLLEEELAAAENEVARKTILIGGPGSRRFDSELCINLEALGWPQERMRDINGIGSDSCSA